MSSSSRLRVVLDHPCALEPARMSADAAGYDLHVCEDAVLLPRARRLVSTGLRVCVPEGTYGRVAPRSGMALRGIDVAAGVIDRDYRGVVHVLLVNNTDAQYDVQRGERIAQLIVEKIETPQVELVEDLDATERQGGGFGSTGSL